MNPLTLADFSLFATIAKIEFKKLSCRNIEDSKGAPYLETSLWRPTSTGFLFGSEMLSFLGLNYILI